MKKLFSKIAAFFQERETADDFEARLLAAEAKQDAQRDAQAEAWYAAHGQELGCDF